MTELAVGLPIRSSEKVAQEQGSPAASIPGTLLVSLLPPATTHKFESAAVVSDVSDTVSNEILK